ncbi:MAG: DUF2892 domain-containing protein [Flavobacteriaceae bacterium]|nr:DUF2892 domain-containing protein [Flavobacteriaceae bacterium]
MKKNVGKTDKIIRTIAAAALFYVAHQVVTENPWNFVLYAFGVVLILTSIFSYCGLYTFLGKNTCEKGD